MTINVFNADCLEWLRQQPDNSIDSIVTDPPYGLSNTKPAQVADVLKAWVTGDTEAVPAKKGGFMGKDWDSFVPPPAVWKECMRVLKPGGHMAVFAGARTQDLMGLSIRLAGFEIREGIGWIFGSGMPKSMDVSKAIDKGQALSKSRAYEFTEWMRSTGITAREINEATGTNMGSHYLTDKTQPAIATADLFDKLRPLLPEVPERIERLVAERTGIEWTDYVKREVVGMREVPQGHAFAGSTYGGDSSNKTVNVTSSHSDAAKQWSGWGTALKPAIEPIILARKPLDGTVANNVLAHGVGGLNIDACRVQTGDTLSFGSRAIGTDSGVYGKQVPKGVGEQNPAGRFPANVLLDEHAAKEMDEQSGITGANVRIGARTPKESGVYGEYEGQATALKDHGDMGGASRFFPVFKYQAKAPKKERPVIEREDGTKIQHPTVKPLALLSWLTNLIVPPGGTVLDPFAGSGTTLQAARDNGFNAIGIEAETDYIQLINQRLNESEK